MIRPQPQFLVLSNLGITTRFGVERLGFGSDSNKFHTSTSINTLLVFTSPQFAALRAFFLFMQTPHAIDLEGDLEREKHFFQITEASCGCLTLRHLRGVSTDPSESSSDVRVQALCEEAQTCFAMNAVRNRAGLTRKR